MASPTLRLWHGFSFALLGALAFGVSPTSLLGAAEPALPIIVNVDVQPLQAQARRVAAALERAGAPLTPAQQQALAVADRQSAKWCIKGVEVC